MEIGSSAWREIIQAGAKFLGIDMDSKGIDRFSLYAGELIKWNRKFNLTAITDPQALAIKHFLDSIAPNALIPLGASVLDIGAGGGFPGIPLKIVRPDLTVTLIDAVRKKVHFQKHIIRTLDLENMVAVQSRAEQFSTKDPFDVVVMRALSALSVFVALARPHLAENGVMLAWKGKLIETQAEVSALLSGENRNRLSATLTPYRLPGLAAERTIVAVKYPRV